MEEIREFGDQPFDFVEDASDERMEVGLSYVDENELSNYITRTVAVLIGQAEESLISEPLSIASESLTTFIKDQQSPIFVVNRLSQNDDASDKPTYAINEMHYNKEHTLTVVFVKKGSAIVSDKPLCEQLNVYSFSGKDSYDLVSEQLKNYFDRAPPAVWLDDYAIQKTGQYEINPLELAAKHELKQTYNTRGERFVPTDDEENKMRIVSRTIGDVEFGGTLYPKLKVYAKRYPHQTPRNDGRNYSYVFTCPFSPSCVVCTRTESEMIKHVCCHFMICSAYCFFCMRGFVNGSALKGHLNSCISWLSTKSINKIAEFSKAEDKLYLGVQSLVKQIWESNSHIIAEDLNLNQATIKQLKKYFPLLFTSFDEVTSFGLHLPPGLDSEFEQIIQDITTGDPVYSNLGKSYIVFETTNGIPTFDDLPKVGRISGSETDSVKNNKIFRQATMSEIKRQDAGYLSKIGEMIKSGRSFEKITVLEGIITDYQFIDQETGEAANYCPRFAVEDAVMRVLRFLSNECWNMNPIPRNEYCPTYNFECDKLILFGIYIIRRQENEIMRQLNNLE